MNYYRLLKYVVNFGLRPRIFGIVVMHILHRRYLLLSVDPSNGCNYKCIMCHRSSGNVANGVRRLSESDVKNVIRAFGRDVLRLQIGCALDPSIAFDESLLLLKEAKKAGIDFVSMCTNGVLLSTQQLKELAASGLDELIISCHGVHKETYERFMRGKFESFLQLLERLREVKSEYPEMTFRVNYTMNADNTEELKDFFNVFDKVCPDMLQLRPIQDIGSQEYTNYDLAPVAALYDSVLKPLAEKCRSKGMHVIIPDMTNLEVLAEDNTAKEELEDLFQQHTQVYVSPDACYHEDFDLNNDTYRSYSKSHHKIRTLLKALLASGGHKKEKDEMSTKPLNYQVK